MFATILLGVLGGVIYFNIMEKDIPRYTNCSYVANIWTDIIAFILGFVVIYYGIIYNNRILIWIGTAIITEHIMQFFGHKYEPFTNADVDPETSRIVKKLVRQSSRYALAAEQDLSPMIAVLHANYSAGYLWALKDIVNEKKINAVLGKNKLKTLEDYITHVQDSSTRKATNNCPEFIGVSANIDVAKLAGDY